jgi:mRNA interferase RelE/StbE
MEVKLRKEALKYLARMNEPMRSAMVKALEGLAEEPPLGDVKRLQGQDGFYRLRVGNYRAIYRVDGAEIIVRAIAPRGEAYKRGER